MSEADKEDLALALLAGGCLVGLGLIWWLG
jgi:hypothetical protein